jgi:hypothetical protein
VNSVTEVSKEGEEWLSLMNFDEKKFLGGHKKKK